MNDQRRMIGFIPSGVYMKALLLVLGFCICILYQNPRIRGIKYNAYSPQPASRFHLDHKTVDAHLFKDLTMNHLNHTCKGPESFAINSKRMVYASLACGSIVGFSLKDPSKIVDEIYVGGRPLGIVFDKEDRLLVAEPTKGLLRVNLDTHRIEVLATFVERPITYINALDVDESDAELYKVYFSDSSTISPFQEMYVDSNSKVITTRYSTYKAAVEEMMSMTNSGRIIRYQESRTDPRNHSLEVLKDGVAYANGVALSWDKDYLIYCETGKTRVNKLWLSGPQAGVNQVLIDNLPGYPDGASLRKNTDSGRKNHFWIALLTQRKSILEFASSSPWIKKVASKFRNWVGIQESDDRTGAIIEINGDTGKVTFFQSLAARGVPGISSIEEHNGELLLGNLMADFFVRLKAPESE